MPVTDSDEDEDPFAKKLKLERETDSEDSMGGRVIYSKSMLKFVFVILAILSPLLSIL